MAQRLNDPNAFASTVAGIMGVKALAIFLCVILTAILVRVVPVFRDYPAIAWGGCLLGTATA